MFDLGVRMRARDDPDIGVGGAGLLDDLSRLEGLRNGNDDVSAFGQSCGLENFGLRGIAHQRFDAALPEFADRAVRSLDHEERQLLLLQVIADDVSDPAVTDQDRVIRQVRDRDRLGRGAARGGRIAAFEPRDQPVDAREHQRIEHDG